MDNEFLTPDGHVGFKAKKLFGELGKIHWGAIAYIEPNGGGPAGNHTHHDGHLFIVVKGRVKVMLDGKENIVRENKSLFIDGRIPHSIWNNSDETAIVIKISTLPEEK